MPIAYISHPDCRRHDMGPGHPEQPARLDAVNDALRARGLLEVAKELEAPRASIEQLSRVHGSDYIERLRALAPTRGLVHFDSDTQMGPGTWDAALRAAGASVHATDLVMGGETSRAFCAVRPPGHHAEGDRAMGFCFFNNVAVGAAHALAAHGVERVAIVDFDAHFGNGTTAIFGDDPRVLTCSIYQHPLFPGLDPPSVPGHEINCPLPPGSGGAALRRVVTERWAPALEEFRPQLLFVSAGFDAAAGERLADLAFTPTDFTWVTRFVCDVATRHADGRVVSTLEGGYDLAQLGAGAAAHFSALMDS